MRADKLTTKFQEALSEAQSLAVGQDHPYIEPAHLLAAMLRQDEGPKALLQRAGVNVNGFADGGGRADQKTAASARAGAGAAGARFAQSAAKYRKRSHETG